MTDGLLLVDKQAGESSHRVVAIARRALGTRDVGHAGTLDPAATGLLVLAVGEGLKLLRYLVLDDKRYEATVVLGVETDSLDAQGTVVTRAEVPPGIDLARVEQAAQPFVGTKLQRAPEVSALKLRGVPLYRRVRRGEQVQAPEREVVLRSLEVRAVREQGIELDVRCGKGFYVRSLARDLAHALGTVGHLAQLRRTKSGPFDVEHAIPMDLLRRAAGGDEEAQALVRSSVIAKEHVLHEAPRAVLSDKGALDAAHGRPVALDDVCEGSSAELEGEPVLLFDRAGTLIALARREPNELRIVRGFRSRS